MSFSIFPRTVYKTTSKISGEIEVKEQLGQYTLHVQGMLQSGGVARGTWKKAFKKFTIYNLQFTNILVLGLGGGTVVGLIKSRWPKAKIIGIEIDPEIVKIGKNYFGLDEINNLKIINADAIDWVETCFNDLNHCNKKVDLIIVDLYLGDKFPKKAESEEFLRNLKKLLAKNGMVVFNRLRIPQMDLTRFEKRLRKHFSIIQTVKAQTNFFFLVGG